MRCKKILSVVAALMMLAGLAQPAALTAFAEDSAADNSYEEKLDNLALICAHTMIDTDYKSTVQRTGTTVSAPAQRKFDLRDVDGKNYVTPVKNQHSAGNCWAFAAMACLETSLLYELGIDLNECDPSEILDFSERQLAWLVAVPLGENSLYPSQTGEGNIHYPSYIEMQKENPDRELIFRDIFAGGYTDYVLSLLSTGQGPVDESLVPNLDDVNMSGTVWIMEVINDPAVCENTDEDPLFDDDKEEEIHFSSKEEFLEIISDETLLGWIPDTYDAASYWYVGNGRYWDYEVDSDAPKLMDWSVDEAYRFSDYTVEHVNYFQKLADTDTDTGAYFLNENVLNSIKNEIVNGRPACLGVRYESESPTSKGRKFNYIDKNGEITDNEYDCAYLCFYNYDSSYNPDDPESVNKVVSANHAVCIVGYDDDFPKEYFYDPKGTIKGNGAFIAKNSYGSKDSYNYYGNNGDGYYYISYYDQALGKSLTVDLMLPDPEADEEEKISFTYEHLYDLMNCPWIMTCRDDEIASANVYNCEYDQKLVSLGTIFTHPNNIVKYDVYILNEDPSGPTDGTLAATMTVSEKYSGYHVTDLPEPLYLKKGTSFSVVVTSQREDGKQEIFFQDGYEEEKAQKTYEEQKAKYIAEHGSEEGFVSGSITCSRDIVNKGESFVYYDGEWFDWTDVKERIRSCGVRPDNPDTTPAEDTSMDNFAIHAYSEYAYFSTDHRIKEPQEKPYKAGDEVVCTVSVTKELGYDTGVCDVYVGEMLIGSIEELAEGEVAELEYTYTVTESDLERGYFENTVQVFFFDDDEFCYEFELLDAFSNTSVRAEVSEPDSESESEPDSESESEPHADPDGTEDEKSPETGDESEIFIVIAAGAVLCMMLLKKRSPQLQDQA